MVIVRGILVILSFLSIVLSGEIRIGGLTQISRTDGCSDFSCLWRKGGEEVVYIKTCKENDKITLSCIVIMEIGSWKKERLVPDTVGRYNEIFLSPDKDYLLARWVSNDERGGPSDFVVVNLNTGETKKYAYVRGNRFVHPDSTLFWDLSKPHEVKWIPKKIYWPLRDSLLREQKHHWPDWVKENLERERGIRIRFKRAKREGKEIKGYKEPETKKISGRAFVKVLERDEKGYVKRAQLWAYPEGKEPYLAMDESLFGSVVCFSPNHRYMIIRGKDKHLYIAHADGSDVTRVTEKPAEFYFEVNWAPDSKKFVYDGTLEGEEEMNIWLVEIKE